MATELKTYWSIDCSIWIQYTIQTPFIVFTDFVLIEAQVQVATV